MNSVKTPEDGDAGVGRRLLVEAKVSSVAGAKGVMELLDRREERY